MKNSSFDEFCALKNIKLTDLRKDILSILFNKKKPLGAYEILKKLRKKRSSAEPPTVYRVLKWLVEAKLVHRIEAQNSYVFCSMFSDKQTLHKSILLSCRSCHNSYEFEDPFISHSIKNFVEKHQLEVDDTLIEVKGICTGCLVKVSHA